MFSSAVRHFNDRLRRQRNSQTVGSATQNGQTGGRRVFRPGRLGKATAQSAADGKRFLVSRAPHA